MPQVDVVIVGLGPGGELASAKLARAGLSVVGIEERLVGGECPFYGCVGSKMMIRAANALAEANRVGRLAGQAVVEPDFGPVAQRIRDEATHHWDDTERVAKLRKIGVDVVRGRGRLAGPATVEVDGVSYRATRAVILNPGTSPSVPPIPGLSDTPFWTNRDVVKVTELPASLLVIGGGPIGAELAQVFSRFGVEVTLVDQAERLLPADEPEAAELVAEVFTREGIRLRLGKPLTRVDFAQGQFTVDVGGEQLVAEQVLVAAGRRPNLADLGLETIDRDPKDLQVGRTFRVAPGVWAIGDVTGQGPFTHTSLAQARVAVADILQDDNPPIWRPDEVPWCTFTDPEVGGVGLTENQARERGYDVRIGLVDLTKTSRGWLHDVGNEGLIKLVVDAERRVLLGATSAGPAGGEVLAALAVALRARMPVDELAQMLIAYPTFAGAIHEAIRDSPAPHL